MHPQDLLQMKHIQSYQNNDSRWTDESSILVEVEGLGISRNTFGCCGGNQEAWGGGRSEMLRQSVKVTATEIAPQ